MVAAPAARSPRSDRRPEIVAVAYRLIAERGLEGLRFADVAREAGINNGTLLYYFASKDALIQAVGAFLVELYSQPTARRARCRASEPRSGVSGALIEAGIGVA